MNKDFIILFGIITTLVIFFPQNVLGNFDGKLDDGDLFSSSVVDIGDLNGDQIEDIVVGSPYDDDDGVDVGAIYILFLNTDGTVKSYQKISDMKMTGGACLIATASFGSELAPQVQLLREIRDNTVLHTYSGTSFMTAFNSFYYSFSPTVADLERQNPMFKEVVKIAITPLISTLGILQDVDIDSEAEMIGYGTGVILLNIGMYSAIPIFSIMIFKKLLR